MSRSAGGMARGVRLLDDRTRLAVCARRLAGKRVLVVGDLLVDEYIYGSTDRVSREAPVLILKYDQQTRVPGGAANSVNNLRAMGADPVPVGIVGNDDAGRALQRMFRSSRIERGGVVVDRRMRTITKTRILAGGVHTTRQQLLRIDREHHLPVQEQIMVRLVRVIERIMSSVDAVLISDYGYGVVNELTRRCVMRAAKRYRLPVVADSRYRLLSFAGVTSATPNELEALAAVGSDSLTGGLGSRLREGPSPPRSSGDMEAPEARRSQRPAGSAEGEAQVVKAGKTLMKRLSIPTLVITRGRLGMMVFHKQDAPLSLPIVGSDEVSDVTGAGDTVSSVIALGLAAGLAIEEAAALATYAASVVVMKEGTATATPQELLRAVASAPIVV